MFVEQKPASITFRARRGGSEERTVRIKCDNKEASMLENEITSCYKAGYSTIVIEGRTLPQHAVNVKKFIHHLSGMDVVEQSLTKIVVRDLIDIKQVALPTLVRRMDMMVRSMVEDTLGEEEVEPAVLRERDLEVNRIQFLIARIVRKVLENPSIANTLQVSVVGAYSIDKVAWALERIGDYVKRFHSAVLKCKEEQRRDDMYEMMRKVYDLYLATMRIHYAHAVEEAVLHHEKVLDQLGESASMDQLGDPHSCLIAIENLKGMLRDFRVILRSTIETPRP